MSAWFVVLAVGLGSYLFRAGIVLIADRVAMPASLHEATELVAPVAFAALAASGVAQACLGVAVTDALPPLVAAAAAASAVARTGRSWVAVIVGLPVLWLVNTVVWLGVRYGQ
jgi:branched-subunit amino acid transport protein